MNKKQEIIAQLVDGIVGKAENERSEPEEERIEQQRKRLSERAMEYLMFLDDEE